MEKDFPKMELDLGHIDERESFSFNERFQVPAHDGSELECSVSVKAEVTRTGSRYLLEADVDCMVGAECSRCLEPFEHRVETAFQLVFQRGEGVTVPEGIDEDDFILLTQTGEYSYDIFPRLKEAVLLELPIKYLCREDCAGICSGCGADLNSGSCSCGREEGDPRWKALRNVLKDETDK